MCQLIEAIKVENGKFCNIDYHINRMKLSSRRLYHRDCDFNLTSILIPDKYIEGLVKLRIVYNLSIISHTFENYSIKKIESLKIIRDDWINYDLKYEDRSEIINLYSKRANCDDIIIIKNGLVTDSSYSNLIFIKGNDYFTPDKPLLMGTKRQKLIDEGKIKTLSILEKDIKKFDFVLLINSMMDLDNCPIILTEQIYN